MFISILYFTYCITFIFCIKKKKNVHSKIANHQKIKLYYFKVVGIGTLIRIKTY
jgi:hypothetical protein